MTSETVLVIINLGCGNNKMPEEIGVDIIDGPCVDIVADLNVYPMPFETNSADIIRSSHCFEYLDNTVALMEDVHRILKPGGILEFTVPHVSNIGFFRDPTHKRPFTFCTMDYFVREIKTVKYTQIEFEYIDRQLRFGGGLRGRIGKLLARVSVRRYEKYYCWKYPAYEIYFRLRALK
ncbi:MAG: methyltransferase domain-containing protein [Gammaproteobacteria bacterium]|nr:methyltransferase domain-containing protein [Gammaproteobacteria bacterium]